MILIHFNSPGKTSLQAANQAPFKIALTKLLLINFLILLCVLCCISAAKAQNEPLLGKALFEKKCATCHGNDGTKGRWGAKNLQTSKLNDNELYTRISIGKGIMPQWGKKLSQTQILSVIEYVKTLRNNHEKD